MRAVDTSTSDRRDRRHAAFRSRLLESVTRLLAAGSSYAELTVEQIASGASTSRSTFYLHFRDKGHLLAEFVDDVMGDLLDLSDPWWSESVPQTPEEVRGQLESIVRRFGRHAGLMIAVAESASFDPGVRDVFEANVAQGRHDLAAHIRRGQAGGWVVAGVDPDALAGWLVWMAERGMSRMTGDAEGADLESQLDALTHVVWSSLYRDAPARGTGLADRVAPRSAGGGRGWGDAGPEPEALGNRGVPRGPRLNPAATSSTRPAIESQIR